MSREERKRQTKEAIVRHAVELFKQKGFENVTVEEITKQCGIAKGTFFNYFAKKEHILLHLTDAYFARLDDIFGQFSDQEPKEGVLRIFSDLLSLYAKHYEILRFALLETVKAPGETNGAGGNIPLFRQKLADFFGEAEAAGRFCGKWEPELTASVLSDLFVQTLIGRSGTDAFDKAEAYEKLKRQIVAVWEGLAHEKG